MDIRTELHNLKRMVLNESHISETSKEKIANRIFEIEKSVAINYTRSCEELCDKCNKENHLQKLTDQAQDLGLGYD